MSTTPRSLDAEGNAKVHRKEPSFRAVPPPPPCSATATNSRPVTALTPSGKKSVDHDDCMFNLPAFVATPKHAGGFSAASARDAGATSEKPFKSALCSVTQPPLQLDVLIQKAAADIGDESFRGASTQRHSCSARTSRDTTDIKASSTRPQKTVMVCVEEGAAPPSKPPASPRGRERGLSIAEKAFGHPPRSVGDAPGVSMSVDCSNAIADLQTPPLTPKANAAERPFTASHRLSVRRGTIFPDGLLPKVPERNHQPRRKTAVEESITRKRLPSAGAKPAFGSSEYVRAGLPTLQEREEMERKHRIQMLLKQHPLQTLEQQIEAHFTDFETVQCGSVDAELAAFEQRLAEEEEKRAEAAAARAEAEALRLAEAAAAQWQQLRKRRASLTPAQSSLPAPRSPQVVAGGLLDAVPGYPSQTPSRAGTPPPSYVESGSDPALSREYHLIKLLFRRSLLKGNKPYEYLQSIGEEEALERLQVLNNRYGCRRLTPEDFFYLMQELVTMPTCSRQVAAEGKSVQWSNNAGLNSSALLGAVSGSLFDEPVPHVVEFAGRRRSKPGGSSEAVPPTQPPPFILCRHDSDVLFAACDMNMSGTVDDDEVVDAFKLLFQSHDVLVASHCKRVIEGRCSISHMLSLHEAEMMLDAVAVVSAHRYGLQSLKEDVAHVVAMFKEVETNGYIPVVCFRNFIVHGRLLSRALAEMTVNAELPHQNIKPPSPDPVRDMAAVRAATLELEMARRNTNSSAGGTGAPPQTPLAVGPSAQIVKKTTVVQPTVPNKARQERDLTHPRFRADMNAMPQRRHDSTIPEHDHPVWYTSNGFVWMANDLHGPTVVL